MAIFTNQSVYHGRHTLAADKPRTISTHSYRICFLSYRLKPLGCARGVVDNGDLKRYPITPKFTFSFYFSYSLNDPKHRSLLHIRAWLTFARHIFFFFCSFGCTKYRDIDPSTSEHATRWNALWQLDFASPLRLGAKKKKKKCTTRSREGILPAHVSTWDGFLFASKLEYNLILKGYRKVIMFNTIIKAPGHRPPP